MENRNAGSSDEADIKEVEVESLCQLSPVRFVDLHFLMSCFQVSLSERSRTELMSLLDKLKAAVKGLCGRMRQRLKGLTVLHSCLCCIYLFL